MRCGARNPRSRPGVLHAYRASRAAQVQPWRTVAVDLQQTHSQDCRVLLHPGTVDTARSRPSQTKVPEGTRFSTERATGRLLGIIAGLGATDSSRFIAWDGGDIPG
jgi:NAD(P)-dependent dehydrogenase (short-subunit alcohol dehydrogenase family)